MWARMLASCLSVAAALTGAPAALAHRPFTSEDTGIVSPGQLELEMGHDFVEAGDGDQSFSGNYTLNVGVSSRVEVDVSGSAIYHLEQDGRTEAGFGDAGLLVKCRFVNEAGKLPSLAVAGSVTLPTGDSDRGLGGSEADYTVLGVTTKTWRLLTVHANAGWAFLSTASDRFLASVAMDYTVAPKWHLLIEWDGATDFESHTEDEQWGVLLGMLFAASEKITWDAGARFGLTSEEDNFTLTSGLTIAF